MRHPLFQSHLRVLRLTAPLLSLVLSTPLLGACTGESGEVVSPGPLPAPGTVEIVTAPRLAPRARVPEKEPGFVSAEIRDRDRDHGHSLDLAIEHDGGLRPFNVGDVLGGTQGGGYLVRVTGVRSLDETHVVLATAPAALPELLSEGEFHLHYDAADYTRRLDAALAQRPAPGSEGGEDIASQGQALKASVGAPIALLSLVGAGLPASCGVGPDGALDLDATASLTPVLDIDVKIGSRGGLNPIPELQELRVVASGRLDVDARLHGTGTLDGRCTIDLLALAGASLSVPLPSLTFWVGPVPVVVTTDIAPRATASVDLSIEAADVSVEAHTIAGLEAGVVHDDAGWSTVWNPSGKATGKASIQASSAITASCEVSVGAELRARLYGVLGPDLGVEAYARVDAATEAPYCSYAAAIEGGVRAYAQAEAGVSIGPLDLSLGRLDLVDLDLVRFDGPRFSGPLREDAACGGEH